MIGLRYLVAWLVFMAGCAETTQLKAQTYAATTLASSYRTLGTVDEVRIAQIRAIPDAVSGALALKAHGQRYDIVKASLGALADLVDKSVAEGMTAALVAPMIAGAEKVIASIEALKKGGP